MDAVGLPGPAIGHINMFLGHSDTGKTTAAIKAAGETSINRWSRTGEIISLVTDKLAKYFFIFQVGSLAFEAFSLVLEKVFGIELGKYIDDAIEKFAGLFAEVGRNKAALKDSIDAVASVPFSNTF